MQHAAIYCRLSREDGDNIESSSIASQKKYLTEYATKNGINIILNCGFMRFFITFAYDGSKYSGYQKQPKQKTHLIGEFCFYIYQ